MKFWDTNNMHQIFSATIRPINKWSKVDNLGLPIGLWRPRLWSIGWFAMPYSSSQGVHSRPKQNIRKIFCMENRHIFGVKQKSFHPEKSNEQFVRFSRVKWFCLHPKDVAIFHAEYASDVLFGAWVDTSWWVVWHCRPTDPNFGLHESINILELSTLDWGVWTVPIVYNTDCFSLTRTYKFL
jgi:hypothetical protein